MRIHPLERWLYRIPPASLALPRQRLDRELDEELRYHVERFTDEHIARGMTA